MKIAIMQPYAFPYLGYFQLIKYVDKFIIYDDVAFIKQGWINRNSIYVNGKAHLFSIPVENISSYTAINETKLSKLYEPWKLKFLKTIEQSYRKSLCYDAFAPVIKDILNQHDTIAELAKSSLELTCRYLDIKTPIVWSSSIYKNNDLKSTERILNICAAEHATTYVNLPGGMSLYDPADFNRCDIGLNFIKPEITPYRDSNDADVSNLSIIDLVMNLPLSEMHLKLNEFKIHEPS